MAMSGGVDSSVAAAILKEQGYEVIGVTMQVWDYSNNHCATDEGSGTCCSNQDVEDARSVADRLEIPFYVVNCESKFKEKVIDGFVGSYLKGETPIPCVDCNTYLKFDHLFLKMKELNCDYLATGHYARIQKGQDGNNFVVTSEDGWKDQTYFLFTLKREILDRLLFPIGDWEKSDIRDYAEKQGLTVARKKDSTGICFIGKSGYAGFVESQIQKDQVRPGQLLKYPNGEVLGEHSGIHKFTIGQRKGLGAYGFPAYVVKIEADSGRVWLGHDSDLYGESLVVKDLNLHEDLKVGQRLRTKIRFAHKGADAEVLSWKDGRLHLRFTEKQRAITSGQAAVFYDENRLLGGGWIE